MRHRLILLTTISFIGVFFVLQEISIKALYTFPSHNVFERSFKTQYDLLDGLTLIDSGKTTIKSLLRKNYDTNKVYIGATLNHRQLGTFVEKLFLKEFTYTTPENCAKQTRVHPKPNVWDWTQVDEFVGFAQNKGIVVRLHGPISPQASKWAYDDNRTVEELDKNMTEYFTALCKRFNDNKTVKWMDVVNETIDRDGEWMQEKEGISKWENPWTQIGMDENNVPLYITKAFAIANKYGTKKSLVFNQHGGMEPLMWERVKKTILYLREQGYRVDGIGWQAHLKSSENVMLDKPSLEYFSSLIDWAHTNNLDFHVTEIDYKVMDESNLPEELEKQAVAYSNVLKVLLSKSKTGVVTFNTWGMVDLPGEHTDSRRFIFDQDGNPKPAYHALKRAIKKNKPLEIIK